MRNKVLANQKYANKDENKQSKQVRNTKQNKRIYTEANISLC